MTRQLRPMSIALLIALLPSCYRWQEYGTSPQAALRAKPNSTLYISRTGDSVTVLRDPAVVGDSLVGKGVPAHAGGPGPRVAIPLTEVEGVRTRRMNGGQTAGLVGGLVAGALLIPVGILLLTYEDDS
jgi:hypothetical protein